MKTNISRNNILAAISFVIPAAMVIIKPLGMTLSQSAVLGFLFLVIVWWGTEWVPRDIASATLLIAFFCFSNTSAIKILNFPLSGNIVMIVAAYLLSQGIVNSKVADKFSDFLLDKYCKTYLHTVVMAFVLCTIFIFFIPQQFPRVVLLATIFNNFLKKNDVLDESKKTILFSIFVASCVTSLLFFNGDVIANYAAIDFSGTSLSYFEWVKYMTVPTIAVTLLVIFSYMLIFKKDLKGTFPERNEIPDLSLGTSEKKAISIVFLIVLLWLTESFHGVDPAIVAGIGVLAMFILRILSFKDFKVVNLSLLLFLTAEFAIGRVLVGSGVAEKIRIALMALLPDMEDPAFLPIVVLSIMGLHMIMGSIITALSFTIPMLVIITNGVFPAEFIALLVLVSVATHYLLPFHHVTIMIGFGSNFYDNKHVIKLGIALTLITFASVFLFYIPWWKLTNLL